PVIVMSAQNTFMTAIRAAEPGAYDYPPKPFDLTGVIHIIRRALAEPKTRPDLEHGDGQTESSPPDGGSAAMHAISRTLARCMNMDAGAKVRLLQLTWPLSRVN